MIGTARRIDVESQPVPLAIRHVGDTARLLLVFVGRLADSIGMVVVDGMGEFDPSLLEAGHQLIIGADFDFVTGEILFASGGTGSVTVSNGGTVRAGAAQGDGIDDIFIGTGGTLQVGVGGTLIGDVVNMGGTFNPGSSPGTVTLGGNFTHAEGTVAIELAGLAAGDFDLIQVGGTAALDGGLLEFAAIDSYIPGAGDSFVVMTADGGLTVSDTLAIAFQGVDRDIEFDVVFDDNEVRLDVLNDAGSGDGVVFLGGAADDRFAGGDGNDRLDGGLGADTITGGSGSDLFVVREGDGGATIALADLITDFEDGNDVIGLDGGLSFADLTVANSAGGDAAVSVTASGEVLAVLDGIDSSLIDQNDFTDLTVA